ncbi:unnamed protein product [Malus baccata var. baccata]
MSGPSDHRFDLNFGEKATMPFQDNIWRPSFLSFTRLLTVGDSVMKNDMTAAVVARNFFTPKDNRLLSKRSDKLAVKYSLALSVECADSVSNVAQSLFARTCQVESLVAEVISLKQQIRASKDQPSVPSFSEVLPSTEVPNNHPPVSPLSGAMQTAETSSEQRL